MRLLDLEPRGFAVDGFRCGFSFECPCCLGTGRGSRLAVVVHHKGHEFEEDRLIKAKLPNEHIWTIDGDDFATLSVTPSIDASAHGHWHGFITQGVVA